ncbi:hypothetical protein XENOCAPTIV_028895, partial [Xenoophorus captivus]
LSVITPEKPLCITACSFSYNSLSRLVPLAGESDVQSIGAGHVLLDRACFINEPIERAQTEGWSPLTAGSTMGGQPGELEWLGDRAPIPEGASATNVLPSDVRQGTFDKWTPLVEFC